MGIFLNLIIIPLAIYFLAVGLLHILKPEWVVELKAWLGHYEGEAPQETPRAKRLEARNVGFQFLTVFGIFMTAWMAHRAALIQRRNVYLDTRPYVQLKFDGPHWKDSIERTKKEGQVEVGGILVYHNHGKVPAVNIRTRFYIGTDKDTENRAPKFYRRSGGRLITVSSLESGGEDYVDGWASLAAGMEFYYIDVIVSYEGVDRGREYWSRLTKVFRIVDRKSGGDDVVEMFGAADWDREQRRNLPKPSRPDFHALSEEAQSGGQK